MKTLLISTSAFATTIAFSTQLYSESAPSSINQAHGGYSVSERGVHHRVWQRVTWKTNDLGRVRGVTNSYTELETGMHYQKEGQWLESEAKIEITPEGASATKGPHKVSFEGNINTIGAIDLITSDGKRMRSHVLGLSYFDTA